MEDVQEEIDAESPVELEKQAKRIGTRPPLSRDVHDVMIQFILENRGTTDAESEMQSWSKWRRSLKRTDFPNYVKGTSYRKRFLNWIDFLDVDSKDGENVLCLKESRKIVPCLEEFPLIILRAHKGIGEFAANNEKANEQKIRSKQSKKEQTENKHNQINQCIILIKEKYAFGCRQFGIRKIHVYREVIGCPECSEGGSFKMPSNEIINKVEMIDPDFGNEMNFIRYHNTPSCMAMNGPTELCIWYNQDDLISESNLYNKLIGVIKEIGVELGQCVQNDDVARDRLFTKICCAEKLVKDLKVDIEPVFCFTNTNEEFLTQYNELQNVYINECNFDVFLHDISLLTNVYRKYKNHKFVNKLNEGFQHYAKGLQRDVNLSMDENCLLILQGSKRKANKNIHCDTKKSKTDLD